MYYHNSPTTKNIKMIKSLRAGDMADAINAMKQITNSYAPIMKALMELRLKELQADRLTARYPEKKAEIDKKMAHNYKLMENKLNKFLSVN